MGCGCKNKGANVAKSNNVVKPAPVSNAQETKPQKNASGTRIIRREIR